MERFEELKQELLKRAKHAGACKEQYARAYSAETLEALMEVCKDNFRWACSHKVLDVDIITQYREEFAVGLIYANENVTQGYLLIGSARVEAYGSASVIAYDSASVEAYDSASVIAHDSASVEAHGSARVIAYGSARVIAYDSASVIAYGSASVEAYDSARVIAYDSASVEAYGSASVEAHDSASVIAHDSARVIAYDSAYLTSYSIIEAKLSDNAIYRIQKDNTVRYANPNIRFELVE